MLNKILEDIEKYHMFRNDDHILAAVSGGSDSVCLLFILMELRESYSLQLSVCHLNHLLRGEEADRDQNFVKDLCEKYSLPFYLKREDAAEYSEEHGCSVETAGRELRYRFFEETAHSIETEQNLPAGSVRVATAHTLSDCIETSLFHFARGCGLKGIASIPPVRGRYIRPLISCTEEDIRSYCKENRIGFVLDSTNLTDEYTRNRIRNHVIPLLKELNPSLMKSYRHSLELFRNDNAALDAVSADLLVQKDGTVLVDLTAEYAFFDAFLGRAILMLSERLEIPVGGEILRLILSRISEMRTDGKNFKVQISADWYGYSSDGFFGFRKSAVLSKPFCFELPADLSEKKESYFSYSNKTAKISVLNDIVFRNLINFQGFHLKNALDYDRIICKADTEKGLLFRSRHTGDTARFFGGGGITGRAFTKSIKKWMNEKKIPVEKRDSIALLACGKEILWAEGFGVSPAYAVNSNTNKILFIDIQ